MFGSVLCKSQHMPELFDVSLTIPNGSQCVAVRRQSFCGMAKRPVDSGMEPVIALTLQFTRCVIFETLDIVKRAASIFCVK